MTGQGQRGGFTLIELLIVVAVIALMAAAAAPAVASLTGANARGAAGEIAGAARYLFDTASLRHVNIFISNWESILFC